VKPRPFTALAVVTVLALVVSIATYASYSRVAEVRVSGAALFPRLAGEAGRVATIVITQGNKTLTLARDQSGWSLADRGGYPAKPDKVRALLIRLAEAELVEAKTRVKERYSLLELEDPQGVDAKSRLARLLDDKGAVVAEVILGKRRSDAFGSTRGGTYVRKPGEAQTWLANADIEAPIGVRDWVQPTVIDIPSTSIASLTVAIPGEEPLKIVRDAADHSKHALAAMPDGKKLKDSYTIGAIVRAASSIDLDDVRKSPAAGQPGGQPGGQASGKDDGVVALEADGGLAATLILRKEGEDYWLSVEAKGADGEAKKTAEDIMHRVQGWEFKLPSGKAQAILKRRADLLEAS
jgi:Domain of unknown function (DUF4340)